ncbi:M56 family metallopeptidase [Streptomyces spiramenti]|uniref:M56 family metallopeptidase n=1 Tax=Streptomyces spiramenti TaxID=2720606 RepID=A0ABX1AN99_9ACTN|nr:M56 family metallopeptidase [Streptomyces spiramenti]NJP67151.1 M56 family metallopeptidase [Streptomyces spiramenti]
MVIALTLLALGGLTAALAPRVLVRGSWPDREPVLALWVWQCVVAAVLMCCVLAMALSGAAAWHRVRGQLFAPAPTSVLDAYALHPDGQQWAAAVALLLAAGGLWTAVMLVREIASARAARRRSRAALLARVPRLPGEEPGGERLVVVEDDRPGAWLLPGPDRQVLITSGALRRLRGKQLDAVLAHEQGHARARHDWLLHCSGALSRGFPQVPVFAGFHREVHRLVEMAADDSASRRYGRMTTALALLGLNEDRDAFAPNRQLPSPLARRVDRLIAPLPRFAGSRRLRLTAAAALLPAVPLLVAFAPGISSLG